MADKFKVQLRRDWQVKPNAEQLDGKVYEFYHGWVIEKEDSDLYAGETAMIPSDENYPRDAPCWIASGDLQRVY